MMWWDAKMLGINDSLNVANGASNYINENVKMQFVIAAKTAQGNIDHERALGGHLGVVQGNIVYKY